MRGGKGKGTRKKGNGEEKGEEGKGKRKRDEKRENNELDDKIRTESAPQGRKNGFWECPNFILKI